MIYLISLLKILGALALTAYIAAIVLLFIFQRQMLYLPTPAYDHPFLIESIEVDGYRIDSIVLNPEKSKALLYFPGNAESVAQSAAIIESLLPEYSVYMMNYPGYGTSEGTPTEQLIYASASALYNQVSQKHSEVSLLGRSLGSGVATYIASQEQIEKLALITPFDSIANVAQKRFPIFPASLLLKDRYNSVNRVDKIKAKTLVVIAETDKTIAFSHTEILLKAFPEDQVEAHTVEGSGHNDIPKFPKYGFLLQEFFKF